MTGNPYPGLRPFERDDAHLFFGREEQVQELVGLLAVHRFLAVVGVSGSGKSSLVKAGLLPALHLGAMGEEFPDWRVAVMTPAADPLGELCNALGSGKALDLDPDCRTLLASTSRGLVERTLRAGLEDGAHLLVVVDQFEELFRYRRDRAEGPDQSARFVRLLLDATEENQKWARIYVLITMRSDFLGDCAEFHDLPEALNRGQYLVPRMTRDERRQAIEKPARAAGAEIDASLVERLLNEAGDDAGQLPVLQHTLRRTFAEFENAGAAGGINLSHYEAAGKLEGALDRHAEALLDAPADSSGGRTGKVFRCLTTMEQGGRKVRRPTELGLLYAVVGAGDAEKKELVKKVIERYSDPDCSMVSLKGPDAAGKIIADISHESLIPGWKSLDRWVDAEAEAVRVYRMAADDVSHYREKGARWQGAKLEQALAYMDPERGIWNQAWAGRLAATAPFAQVCDFLKGQKDDQEKEEKEIEARHAKDLAAAQQALKDAEDLARIKAKKNLWAWFARLLVLVVLGLSLAVVFYRFRQAESDKARAQSEKARYVAEKKWIAATDLTQVLQQQIADYDHTLRNLSDQIGKAGHSTVADLQKQRQQIESQRNAAQATLTTAMKSRTRVNPVDGLTYVFIPPGAFTMGCSPGDNECEDDAKTELMFSIRAKPPHAEQIANGFWLGQTEVTQAAWKRVMNDNPSFFKGDQLPVEGVDWTQAGNYCKAIGGRLPTEKEWEYAARGGTTGPRYGPLDAVAWYNGNSGGAIHPVGLKQANAFGLYDMLGNEWEWTADNYDAAGQYRVLRGGSWGEYSRSVRASYRYAGPPLLQIVDIGFRCVGEFR